MLTGAQVAGLIVAVFWVVLVCFLAYVLLRVARLLTETTRLVADVGDRTAPLLDDMTATVAQANQQLARVDVITEHAAGVGRQMSAITTTASSVVGGPLVKAAAFSYGVRRALTVRGRDRRRVVPVVVRRSGGSR